MKKETNMKPEAALAQTAETTTPAAFKCPNCMMADRCVQCNCLGSDGWCHEHGGWSDPQDLCCDWYYTH